MLTQSDSAKNILDMIMKSKIFEIAEINGEVHRPPWLLPAVDAPDRYSAAKNEKW
jgi:hypothetical protein